MKVSVGEGTLVPMQVIHARLEGDALLSENTNKQSEKLMFHTKTSEVPSFYTPIHSVYTYCTITIKHIKYNLVYVMYYPCLCRSVTK